MAITHFEILTIPDERKITSLISGAPIILNQLYPIALEAFVTFERTTELFNFTVRENCFWRAHNVPDSIVGNTASITMYWQASDEGLDPISQDQDVTIFNDQVVPLLASLPLNEATEYIVIEEMQGIENLKLDGNNVYLTQKILTQDLVLAQYTSLPEGGGDPYFIFDYQVGKGDDINPTVFRLTYRIDSLAKISVVEELLEEYLEEYDVLGVPTEYNVKEQVFNLLIDAGYQNASATVQVVINSPYLALNIWNNVRIGYGEPDDIVKYADETFTFNAVLDSLGKINLRFENQIIEDTVVAKLGQIDVTLLSINGDVLLVDGINNFVQLDTIY